MKIVLDSNVLLISFGKRSKFRPIWDAFITGKFQLIISEEIIHEYEEIMQQHAASGSAKIVLKIFAESPDIIFKRTYYHWNSIAKDPDDNKFFDVAFAGNANNLVTNDKHFNEVKKLSFPIVNIISSEEFLKVLHYQ